MISCYRPHGSRQRINHLGLCRDTCFCSSVRTISRCKKRKTGCTSYKWGLGENIVLRLMEYMPPTVCYHLFMNNYFISFQLAKSEQQLCSTKISYENALSMAKNSGKEFALNSVDQAQKQLNFDDGWLKQKQGGLHSLF